MGNRIVSVHVTGSHHNGQGSDIDQMAADFVDALKTKGHNVTAASIVAGGEGDLLNPAARFPRGAGDMVASIRADILKIVGRIETDLVAHPALTWAQSKLHNAAAHLDRYLKGSWTEPPVVQGVTVDDRGVILAIDPPPAG
jgi:hypothetical protein